MLVTSDIFDFNIITRRHHGLWRENLVAGIDLHGTNWPGYQAAARFMLEAAKQCGVGDQMLYAGYGPANEARFRNISVKSFDRLIRGALRGAKDARSVLLTGERETLGTENGYISLGGEIGDIRRHRGMQGPIPVAGPPWRFHGAFVFPLDEKLTTTASDLLTLAAGLLGAEYGYLFVREEFLNPWSYAAGMIGYMDPADKVATDDAIEILKWFDHYLEGRLWSERAWFRDLYQVNMLSERHAVTPVEGLGLLPDWIAAEPGRGQIAALNEGRWLWTLTDAEMVAVRPRLNEAGLLLSCNSRVYRDLPGGGTAGAAGGQ